MNYPLHEKGGNTELLPIVFPTANLIVSVESLQKGEEEKLSLALHQLKEEDPTLFIEHSHEMKQTLLHCQGDMHLAVIKWKIGQMHHISVRFGRSRIPYRETTRKMAEANYRHKKQSGVSGQFGEVSMRIEPWYEGMPEPEN